jgi:hypothetical protein
MDQPDYKENKLSLENDLYQQITWLSIIESISSRFKDSSIIVSPEDLKNISGGYFSKSPWKKFESHRGDQVANIILKSYCAIYSKSTTGQVKVISFYSDSENKWIRFRMIELLNRYSQKLIEFDWNDNLITLYDINDEKKWVFQLSQLELNLLQELFESILDELYNIETDLANKEEQEKKAIDEAISNYVLNNGSDNTSSLVIDETTNIFDLLEKPEDVEKLLYKYEENIVTNFKKGYQNIERLIINLNTEKKILNILFDIIVEHSNMTLFITHLHILKNRIHIFQLIYFYSIIMIISIYENKSNLYHIIYNIFDKMDLFTSGNNVLILSNLSNSIELLNETFIDINANSNQLHSEQLIIKQTLEANLAIVNKANNELLDIKSETDFKNLYLRILNYEYVKVNMDDLV